jgi:hypothetical protein
MNCEENRDALQPENTASTNAKTEQEVAELPQPPHFNQRQILVHRFNYTTDRTSKVFRTAFRARFNSHAAVYILQLCIQHVEGAIIIAAKPCVLRVCAYAYNLKLFSSLLHPKGSANRVLSGELFFAPNPRLMTATPEELDASRRSNERP